MTRRYYECGICGGIHRWEWDGDCRDKYANCMNEVDSLEAAGVDVDVLTWEDRIAADAADWFRDTMEWKNNEEENAVEQEVADKHHEK